MTYQSGKFFRDKFSFFFFFYFAIRIYVSVKSRYFAIKKSYSHIPGVFSGLLFFVKTTLMETL